VSEAALSRLLGLEAEVNPRVMLKHETASHAIGSPPAPVSVPHDHQHGPTPFSADLEALDKSQNDQEHRRGDANLIVRGAEHRSETWPFP